MTSFRVVLVAAAPGRAEMLARGIVRARLAACVSVIPRVASHYRWKGKIERTAEALLVCKTRAGLLKKLAAFVQKNHGYEVPEVLALPVVFGGKAYLDWLAEETA